MPSLSILAVALLLAFVACDSAPAPADETDAPAGDTEADSQDQPSTAEGALRDACYHIDVTGDLEGSVTCADQRRREAGDHLVLQIGDHQITLRLSFPDDLKPEQYPFGPQRDDHTVAAELSIVDDDDQRHRFTPDEDSGSITVMRIDDEAISALFDFEAQLDDPALAITVRGHLRDLEF